MSWSQEGEPFRWAGITHRARTNPYLGACAPDPVGTFGASESPCA
jgi:hypothetical protein